MNNNIAYLIDTISTDTSGTEKQLLETIKRIDKEKFDVSLICLRSTPWLKKNVMPCPCNVLGYKGFLSISFPSVVNRLKRLLIEKQIDVLHVFFEDSIFVAYLSVKFSRLKLVLLSSRRDIGLGQQNQPWYHRLYPLVLPFVNTLYTGIVCNSQQVKEYVAKRERTPREKIKVIYNGVAFPEHTEHIPPVFIDNPADVWIAIVASLTPVKRHDVLIRAIARLRMNLDGLKIGFLFLGKGREKENLVQLAIKENVQNWIHFEGAVYNVSEYLQHVDIGVLCSDREGLSNSILEYMASGLPVVATAVGGNTELVSRDNGRCVPPGDPVALANALRELITDRAKRVRMGLISSKIATEQFSWQSSMRDLEKYYQTLIDQKNGQ